MPLRNARTKDVFLPPGHDHGRCSADAMARAEALCAERAQRLTASRRLVLETLASSHRPIGAYEIIERLADHGRRPAPITVYRALDFLVENGLVHRIESRNAFFACINRHDTGTMAVFFICESCGAVGEAPSVAVADALLAAATGAAFSPTTPVIEIAGICAHCRAA